MKKKKSIIVPCVVLVIGLIGMIISGIYLYNYWMPRLRAQQELDSLDDMIGDEDEERNPYVRRNPIDVTKEDDTKDHPIRHSKYDKLYEENPDFVGWIEVPGTNIDYPVMQTKDESKKAWEDRNREDWYLHHNFYGNWTYEGLPFCSANSDVARPSDNTVIYGHHMKYGTVFHNLTKFEDKSFYKEHNIFYFDNIYRSGTYEIVGVVKTDVNKGSYEYWNVTDCNAEEFYSYVDWVKDNSLYKIKAMNDVEYGDILVTLSTCEYHTNNGRLIVVGKMIETDDIYLT